MTRVSPEWLELRESADASARSPELVERIRQRVPGRAVIHDLGCGTGSMGRWLAPQLSATQHWILHDRDAELLTRAAADPPRAGGDGSQVTVETRRDDITRLGPTELRGAALITASALLDILTDQELDRLVATCVEPGCPVLMALTVIGRVDLIPTDPLDEVLASAFNAHQRRTVDHRSLLGPEAVEAAVAAFTRRGVQVMVRPSPWQLGEEHAALLAEWLTGWLGAAREERPELAEPIDRYASRRLTQARDGRLRVRVHHLDLLALG